MRATAFIGFGSNLGNLTQNYSKALFLLQNNPEIFHVRSASLYESEPLTINHDKQNWYLNTVFQVQTSLKMKALFSFLKAIELQMGRKNTKKWTSRIVDLDLLLYENFIFQDDEIAIPHKELHKRRFVLEPLIELNPNLEHPEFLVSMTELLRVCEDSLQVHRLGQTKEVQKNAYQYH